MLQVEKLLVFLASPGDVPTERRHTREVIDELNGTVAAERGLVLQVVDWKHNAFPGYGTDAQALINTQIAEMAKYTLFVGIMWNRLGTPTPRAESGTVEEFERAVAAFNKAGKPKIWFYFREAAFNLKTEDEAEQRRKVLAFKKRVQANGMPWNYRSPSGFRDTFRNHMLVWLSNQSAPVTTHLVSSRNEVQDALVKFKIQLFHQRDSPNAEPWYEISQDVFRRKFEIAADPVFDVSVTNRSGMTLTLFRVGIRILQRSRATGGMMGWPTELETQADLHVHCHEEWKRFDLSKDQCWTRLPKRIGMEKDAYPFTFTLLLENFCDIDNASTSELRFCVETEEGTVESESIFLWQ